MFFCSIRNPLSDISENGGVRKFKCHLSIKAMKNIDKINFSRTLEIKQRPAVNWGKHFLKMADSQ
jgi:hypothetical protein